MIEGGGQDPGSARRVRAARRRRRRTWLAIFALGLLVAAALFGRRLLEGGSLPVASDEAGAPPATGPAKPREAAPLAPQAEPAPG